jgi:hypothetical protein
MATITAIIAALSATKARLRERLISASLMLAGSGRCGWADSR